MADLVSGRYGQKNPYFNALGQPTNSTTVIIPARSNVEYLGIAGQTDQAAALVTTKSTFVPVPVDSGTTISTITVVSGATAASTPTHNQAYLLSGALTTATLLGTTTDLAAAAVAANSKVVWTLTSPYTIKDADIPFGYIYVGIGFTGTTPYSIVGSGVSTADFSFVASSIFVNKPLLASTQAVGASGTAPATVTLASNAAQAACPWVFLA